LYDCAVELDLNVAAEFQRHGVQPAQMRLFEITGLDGYLHFNGSEAQPSS